jgi:hypothetical protein
VLSRRVPCQPPARYHPPAVEQTRQQRVISDAPAQLTLDRSDERAAYGARLDNADTIAADDASHREEAEYRLPEKTDSEDRGGPHRKSENYAAQFPA